MSTKIFTKIDSIEAEAEKIIQDAKNEASLMARSAQDQGQKLIDATTKNSRKEAQKIIDKAQEQSHAQAAQLVASTKTELTKLRSSLKEKIDQAKKILK